MTLFAAPPLRLLGSGRTMRSSRAQAAERMTSWVSDSFGMGVLLGVARPATIASLLQPQALHIGRAGLPGQKLAAQAACSPSWKAMPVMRLRSSA